MPKRPWTILGRLSQAVREQNWFAVALEMVIVVLGVFLGIQLGNWNADLSDQALERIYLQRLYDEAAYGLDGILASTDQQWTLFHNDALDILTLMDGGGAGLDALTEDQCETIGRLSLIIAFPYQFPSLEELLSSGRLGIIRSQEIRSALTDYDLMQKNSASLITHYTRGMGELAVQFPEYLVTRHRVEDGRLVERYTCRPDLMRGDVAFRNTLQNAISNFSGYYEGVLRLEIDSVARIHALLGEVLDLHHDRDTP